MVVNEKNYVIASKTFPIMFYDESGRQTEYFQEAMTPDKSYAEGILKTFDFVDDYQILEVKIRYEI